MMALHLVFLLVMTAASISARGVLGAQCSSRHPQRRDCGFGEITHGECVARGCCWDPCPTCPRSVPWCYLSDEMLNPPCLVAYEEKEDCGYRGIQRTQCLRRGCCWVPTNNRNTPWCFRAKALTTPFRTTRPPRTTTTTEYGIEGEVRVVDGPTWDSGRVEIYHQGRWGTICDDNFGPEEAQIVCRQIGSSGGSPKGEAYFGEGTGPIWLDSLGCGGHESNLQDCDHEGWGSHDCSHGEDAGVQCAPTTTRPPRTTTTTEYAIEEIRLVNGSNPFSGRVEIFHGGSWGTVCDDMFSESAAKVVCRQLGLSGGHVHEAAHYGPGLGLIWLDSVECNGHEQSLTECSHEPWGSNDCQHGEDVGVECRSDNGGETGNEGQIRLVNGSTPFSGRVEIFHEGSWGTVCDDGFTRSSAEVACRQLGLRGGHPYELAHYGSGTGNIWLDQVKCNGLEQSLTECSHEPWGSNDCSHGEDVGVECHGGNVSPQEVQVRISGPEGPGGFLGLVEVYYNGEWGTVCNDQWETAEANVVCRQLGFSGGDPVTDDSFGAGSGRIWLDDLQCDGSETNIGLCRHSGWGDHDCTHDEDAGVVCYYASGD